MTDTDESFIQESLLQFPCEFPIKAMGRMADDVEQQVLRIIRQHAPEVPAQAVHTRPSKNEKYLAITVTIQATSRAQLDAIYQDLTRCQAVLMAL